MYRIDSTDVITDTKTGEQFIKLNDEFHKILISKKAYPLELEEETKPATRSEGISRFLEGFKGSELSIMKLYGKYRASGGDGSYSLFYRVYKANFGNSNE